MSLATPMCLYESVIYHDGPLRWWGLDEASHTADDSGNGGSLTTVGGGGSLIASLLTYDAAGTADGARRLNGTTQAYTASSFTIANGYRFSLELWAKFNTVTGNQTILNFGTNMPQFRRSGTELELLVEGGAQWGITSGANLNTSTVYHIVLSISYDDFTFNAFGGSQHPGYFYINNVRFDRGGGSGTFAFTSQTWAPRLGGSAALGWLSADIDEVAVYDYGLSENQIAQHYNAGKNGTWGTQLLGAGGAGKYPRFMVEGAFSQTYQYQGLSQRFMDVSALTRRVDFFRGGENAALKPPRAGTMSVDLLNTSGQFEDNTNATYYSVDSGRSYAEPGKAIRFRLWWPDTASPVYSMFYGYIDELAFRRVPGRDPYVRISASDVFKFLSQAPGSGFSRLEEDADNRIAGILGETTWDLNLPQVFDDSTVTIDFKVLSGNILTLIEETTFTEGGGSVFFQGGDGRLRFFNKTKRSGGSVVATYGAYQTADDGFMGDGHFTTSTAGWVPGGTNTITRGNYVTVSPDTDSPQAKITYQDTLNLVTMASTLTANTYYTWSMWMYIPTDWNGGAITLGDAGSWSDATDEFSAGADMSIRDKWQQVGYVLRAGTSDLSGNFTIIAASAPTAGRSIYIDGVSLHAATGAFPYQGSEPVHDDESVFTTVTFKNTGASLTTTQTNDTYKRKHGDRATTRDILIEVQADLDAAALAYLNLFKESSKRIPSIRPVPAGSTTSTVANAWKAFMAHEISDKIVVVDRLEGGFGVKDLTLYVEGIGMRVDASQAECLLTVSPFA